ncbi:Ribokinase-like protein [Dentipellis sp. KUC8613]|nr:Ribokinase-like protein [Dentipellis sp. KUC8613]
MIVDRGADFPAEIESQLVAYGKDMWLFRDHSGQTTRALNSYKGDHRGFEYLTPRIRLTPFDLKDTAFANPRSLHFICSPSRASVIVSEIKAIDGWSPTTIYEPIPDRCVPEELPALIEVLPSISILSPNAEEALSLLSIPLPATKPKIEEACARFLEIGVGPGRDGWVIVRSGALGAYVASAERKGEWISAFWEDEQKVVDVTGAGNEYGQALLEKRTCHVTETRGDVASGHGRNS